MLGKIGKDGALSWVDRDWIWSILGGERSTTEWLYETPHHICCQVSHDPGLEVITTTLWVTLSVATKML